MAPKRNPRHEHPASIKDCGSTTTAASRLPSDVIGVIAGFLPVSTDALRPLMLVSNSWFRGVAEQDGMRPKPGVRWPWVALAHRKPCSVTLVAVVEEAVYELVEAVPDLEELIVDGPVKEPAALQYLTSLAKLTSLQFLRCYGRSVCAIVSRVVKLPQLQKLVLNEPEIKNPELKSITQKLPELRSLTITMKPEENAFTNTSLKYIGDGLHKLEELRIPYASKVTDVGIGHVAAGCPELTSLDLQQYIKITCKSLEHLKQCKKLTSLDLSQTNALADTGLQHLGEMVQLRTLIVAGCASDFEVSEECLQCFRNLVNLETVRFVKMGWVYGRLVGGEFLNELGKQLCSNSLRELHVFGTTHVPVSQLKQLQTLKLWCRYIDVSSATIGDGCPELTELEIMTDNVFSDADAQQIAKLSKLKSLSLQGCELTEAGGLCLAQGLLELESISIRGLSDYHGYRRAERCISNGFLTHVSRLPKLKELTINSEALIDDAGLTCLKNMQTISLPYVLYYLSDGGMKQLVDNNPDLTHFEIATATNASLQYVAHNLRHLKTLKVIPKGSTAEVGIQTVIKNKNMKELEELCVGVDMLDDKELKKKKRLIQNGLKNIGQHLTQLRVLEIGSYKIVHDEDVLKEVSSLTRLKSLKMRMCHRSGDALLFGA